jgi:DnaJ family protein C protein 19
MAILFLAAAGGLLWAWSTGRLKGFTYEDGVAAAIFLLGLRLLTTGRLLPGAALMAGALFWAAWRRGRPGPKPMPVEDARRLLGVRHDATVAEIRDAHRRLIAKVHPDAGGSAELAHRVNVARDTLVAEMNRRSLRES